MNGQNEGYRSHLKIHMSLAKGGSVYSWELTDYPGILITRTRDSSASKVRQEIFYNEQEYPTIAAAVAAWSQPKPKEATMETQQTTTQAPTENPVAVVKEMKAPTLRALVENELQIMQALYDAGGEITPEIAERLAISENALPEKVDGYAHMIDRLTSEAQRLEIIEEQYRQMIGSLHKAIDWMKETLKTSMIQLGVEEMNGIDRKFRLQRAAPRLEVNKDYLPAVYMREEIVYKNNTDQIKKDLADGVKVPGARLVESYYVKAYANSPTKLAEPKKNKRSKKDEVQ